MTCIIGIECENKVYLAGDVQGTGWNNKIVHTEPKVYKKNDVIFGYTTSYRFGQIIEHHIDVPLIPEDKSKIYQWICTQFIPNIRQTLTEHEYEGGGEMLFGVGNELWKLQEDFSVLRAACGYNAVGSGTEYAIGSIFTSVSSRQVNSDNVEDVLKLAIKAAGNYSPSVGIDCKIIST